jgi:hypothetical protein
MIRAVHTCYERLPIVTTTPERKPKHTGVQQRE